MGEGGQCHAPAALPSGKRHGTHYIGGWVSPTAGLDVCGKFRPHWDLIPAPHIVLRLRIIGSIALLQRKVSVVCGGTSVLSVSS